MIFSITISITCSTSSLAPACAFSPSSGFLQSTGTLHVGAIGTVQPRGPPPKHCHKQPRNTPLSDVTIRPAEAKDEARWRELWAGYIKFYRASVSDEITTNTWSRILDPQSNIGALVAVRAGVVIGFCNYLFHDNTWSMQPICYLQDLFVDPAARGGGAAKALILACEEQAKQNGAFRIYWQTQEYNAAARSLYDTITPRSSFIVYRKNV
jgi:GNAT superfamily N-acetyltransferase